MLNKKTVLTIVAIVLVALGVNLEELGIDLNKLGVPTTQSAQTSSTTNSQQTSAQKTPSAHTKDWSDSNPKVNLRHVFEGEINRKGKPVGFHSRPNGQDPEGARVVRVQSKANSHGVYTATVEIRDGSQWKEKFSSFFPDTMTHDEVLGAILQAYKMSKAPGQQPWSGPSGHGFEIQGYTLRDGDINTAFPVYKK